MDFSHINKQTSNSFHQQKNTIKKLMQGKTILCSHCNHPIKLYLPEDKQANGARCDKGCTNIALEFS